MLRVIYFGGKSILRKKYGEQIQGRVQNFKIDFFLILNSWWILWKTFIILVFDFNWLHALWVTAKLNE